MGEGVRRGGRHRARGDAHVHRNSAPRHPLRVEGTSSRVGLTAMLPRLAAGADVAVFPFVAAGGRDAVANLHLARGLRVVETPRAATVLLVIGRLTRALTAPLLRIHDPMAEHWVDSFEGRPVGKAWGTQS